MSDPVITVEKLSKQYRIDAPRVSPTGAAGAAGPLGRLARRLRPAKTTEILWALRDVNLQIGSGEVVGFIGLNGAGKSTLLKILSRITEPTEGRATILGRVGTLLEVGTGFHPELTGRENIYLSGAILGMKRVEIAGKFDEIVAFSEVERFLDTPVKRYSSGMYVRLAFAVAAHLEPEILLVDEVLAVGDMVFQRKCLGAMSDVARKGRTVLFVSHNMIAVQNLCKRVIWLDKGRLMQDGPSADVVGHYLSASFTPRTEQVWNTPQDAPGNDKVRLRRVAVRAHSADTLISASRPVDVEVEYWNLVPDARLHVSLQLINEQQIVAFATSSNETDPVTRDQPLPVGLLRSVCRIPGHLLNTGAHRVLLGILLNGQKILLRIDDALTFDVVETETRAGAWYGREAGAVRPRLPWRTTIVDQSEPKASAASLEPVSDAPATTAR
jgi:lipopolysaccharide transport system ATP-binding protein